MSGRYSEKYDRRGNHGGSSKARSRSPPSPGRNHHRRYTSDEDEDERHSGRHRSEMKRSGEKERHKNRERSPDSDGEIKTVLPPPPPRISKVTMSFGNPQPSPKAIQMKLNPVGRSEAGKLTVASAFNADSDDEVEEMPAECRMRMRNIGRDTPTSSGPNSFGKTKQGFCDSKKIFEKTIKRTPTE